MRVTVNYIDTIEGGSGQVSIELEELPNWLAHRRGHLVREVIPDYDGYETYREVRREGFSKLIQKLQSYI